MYGRRVVKVDGGRGYRARSKHMSSTTLFKEPLFFAMLSMISPDKLCKPPRRSAPVALLLGCFPMATKLDFTNLLVVAWALR